MKLEKRTITTKNNNNNNYNKNIWFIFRMGQIHRIYHIITNKRAFTFSTATRFSSRSRSCSAHFASLHFTSLQNIPFDLTFPLHPLRAFNNDMSFCFALWNEAKDHHKPFLQLTRNRLLKGKYEWNQSCSSIFHSVLYYLWFLISFYLF